MTPIEKNIIVVDEQGNEYEATYPKRANGLVKNGRARFIDENTICLACPPKNETEDNKMSDNKSVNENIELINSDIVDTTKKLTAKDIFDRISKLQKQITENSYYSLHRLDDCITSLYDHEDVSSTGEEIEEVCSVFKEREKTLMKMLEMYERMYDDLCSTTPESKRIEAVRLSVSAELELIRSSDLPGPDKWEMQKEAIKEGRTKMLDVKASLPMTKEDVSAKMADIIADPNVDVPTKDHARAVLQSFMEWN
ncbi:MAG: hypothetical protein IKU19_08655 [Clostridia bacterium]|nr:hypothetical protein [Clostridia bacterium]